MWGRGWKREVGEALKGKRNGQLVVPRLLFVPVDDTGRYWQPLVAFLSCVVKILGNADGVIVVIVTQPNIS